MRSSYWLLLCGAISATVAWDRRTSAALGGSPAPAASSLDATSAPRTVSTLSPPLELGHSAQLQAYRIRLVSQRDCAPSITGHHRSALHAWAVELEVTNTSRELVPVNPFYATLQDEERFNYVTSLSDCGALLASKLLVPNETVRGFVPFEIPRALGQVVLTYRPFFRDGVDRSVRFKLEL